MDHFPEVLDRALRRLVAADLPDFLCRQRWFGSKGRRLTVASLLDWAPISESPLGPWLTLVEVSFETGPRELYSVPLAVRPEGNSQGQVVGRLDIEGPARYVCDGFEDHEFRLALLSRIEEGVTVPTRKGSLKFARLGPFPALRAASSRSSRRVTSEQSNSSSVYDDALILKAIRKLEPGINPDREITGFLTTRTQFRNIPLLAGAIDYSSPSGLEATLGMLQHFVPNEGDGWAYALDHLRQFYEFVDRRPDPGDYDRDRSAQRVREFSAGFFMTIRRLGALTGSLHAALASDLADPAFAPESILEEDVERWATDIRRHIRDALDEIRGRFDILQTPHKADAQAVLSREAELVRQVTALEILKRDRCAKIRIHGDYHLGQTLWTHGDFVILDFEGEPARSLTERRAKHSALKDVAGMLRSFDYAVAAALRDLPAAHQRGGEHLEASGEIWASIAADAFLEGYQAEAVQASVKLLPASRPELERALAVYQLDKALYELRYEINNRPAWLPIPLRGLSRILSRAS